MPAKKKTAKKKTAKKKTARKKTAAKKKTAKKKTAKKKTTKKKTAKKKTAKKKTTKKKTAKKKTAARKKTSARKKKTSRKKSGRSVKPWRDRFKQELPGPWTCPKCGPLPARAQPLYGEDERHHCPNLDCDKVVRFLSKEELEPNTDRRAGSSWPPQRNKGKKSG